MPSPAPRAARRWTGGSRKRGAGGTAGERIRVRDAARYDLPRLLLPRLADAERLRVVDRFALDFAFAVDFDERRRMVAGVSSAVTRSLMRSPRIVWR